MIIMTTCKKGTALAVLLVIFSTIVSAQDQVLLLPSPMQVAYAGGPARLQCLTSLITRPTATIEWFFNETLTISSLNNVTATLSRGEMNEIQASLLAFAAVPVEYNMTRIHCHVEFTTGSPSTSTTTVLLVQGLLDAVDPRIHMSEDFIIISNWTAPFTLLGASEITYCVDVVDLTTRRTLLSECGTNITEFTYTAMPRDFACGDLSFTVTPVNVVGNGTSATVGLTNLRSNPLTPPQLVSLTNIAPTEYVLEMSAPVCDAELRFVDVDTGEIITLGDTDVTITETNITFSTQQLRENRNYNVTIIASNTAGNATSETCIGTRGMRSLISTTTTTEPGTRMPHFMEAVVGMAGGLVILTLVSTIQSVVIVILCCKRQKVPVKPNQPEVQNLQLYEEVRDQKDSTAPTGAAVSTSSSKELAVLVPQYEDITLYAAGVANKSGDPYQITQCSAYGVNTKTPIV